jgi:hypothetical protein
MRKRSLIVMVAFVTLILMNFSTIAFAQRGSGKVTGQTVFVGSTLNDLTENINTGSRLFIRNTDLKNSIYIVSVKFYDPNGREVKEYLEEPDPTEIQVHALASVSFTPPSTETSWPADGGRPCFIVKWRALNKVTPPSIEAVNIVRQFVDISGVNTMLFQAMSYSQGIILEETY